MSAPSTREEEESIGFSFDTPSQSKLMFSRDMYLWAIKYNLMIMISE